jgi:hypothetical protein
MVFTNAYPSDRDSNRGIVSLLKLGTWGIGSSELFVCYSVIKHLYEYVTQIHREPDVVLMFTVAYIFVSVLRCIVCVYGYNFLGAHTERTAENFTGLFSLFNVILGFHGILCLAIYQFLNFHFDMYKKKFGNELDVGITSAISDTQQFILIQFSGFFMYYVFFRILENKEASQPKILDTIAANISHTSE